MEFSLHWFQREISLIYWAYNYQNCITTLTDDFTAADRRGRPTRRAVWQVYPYPTYSDKIPPPPPRNSLLLGFVTAYLPLHWPISHPSDLPWRLYRAHPSLTRQIKAPGTPTSHTRIVRGPSTTLCVQPKAEEACPLVWFLPDHYCPACGVFVLEQGPLSMGRVLLSPRHEERGIGPESIGLL